VAAWRRLEGLRAEHRAETAGYDAILMPTTGNLPPVVDRLLADPAHFTEENLLTLRNTRVANLMDLCALTLPTGIPSCGLSVMAPAGAEARLLRLGRAIERALGQQPAG
jgi:aspartyl-tRNA(Asn)/glutamyl-tRNA(Gln) amidotransferase subunit A